MWSSSVPLSARVLEAPPLHALLGAPRARVAPWLLAAALPMGLQRPLTLLGSQAPGCPELPACCSIFTLWRFPNVGVGGEPRGQPLSPERVEE